ncbi:MAG TPA: hypothetical protein VG478_03920 [Acidimicrobiales bacterium]|jgi:hypothetical protein|nr:hypothetical protein [Acidimicrobiales bacterium]
MTAEPGARDPLRMVRLATLPDPFSARVLAARLGAEGLVWELRGGDGPYPVGPVHLFVPERELADAQDVLAATEELAPDSEPWSPG